MKCIKKKKLAAIRGEIGAKLRIYNPPEHLEEIIRSRLTYNNPLYANISRFSPWGAANTPTHVCLAERMPDYLEVPRGFDYTKLSGRARDMWERIVWEDLRNSVPTKFPKPLIQLNDNQRKVVARYIKEVIKNNERPFGSSLIVVPTSGGKTILSASLAAASGERTLVLCKTNLIRKAWEDDLQKLFGLNPRKDLGIVQQKKFVLGKYFTLASTATLARRKHLFVELFQDVGCLIIDECQSIGSDTIDMIVSNCPARVIIGVTATPNRRDHKHYLVYGHLGQPLVRVRNKQEETDSSYPLSDAKIVRTLYQFKDAETGDPFDPELNRYTELMASVAADRERNNLIVEHVYDDWKAGHSVLVAVDTLKHIDTLRALFRARGITGITAITGAINSSKKKQAEVVGQVMERKCRVVLATKAAIKLGANLNPLDRLHCTTPVNIEDLEQLIGRIRRKHPSKKDAKLTYYADSNDDFLRRKFNSVFYKTMRKLKVPRYENMYVC